MTVGYYGDLEIDLLMTKTALEFIDQLRANFARIRIPIWMISDVGL